MERTSDENILIRPAHEGDLDGILKLYRELEGAYEVADGPAEPTLPTLEDYRIMFREILSDQNQVIMVAESKDVLVGTVTLVVVPNLGHRGCPWAALDNLVVMPDWRGHGIGTSLVEAVSNLARQRGCYKLVLSSNIRRTDAHRFYRRLGWRLTHLGFEIGRQEFLTKA
jgi:GNAT superfamily N-acetyltransferase